MDTNSKRIQIDLDTTSANTVVSDKVWNLIKAPAFSNAQKLIAYWGFMVQTKSLAKVFARSIKEEKKLELVKGNNNASSLLDRK